MSPQPPPATPDPRAALARAHALAQSHQLTAARHELAPFARQAAPPPAILAALGRIDLALGRLGSARRFLERTLKQIPTAPAVQVDLGTVLLRQGHLHDADRLLRPRLQRWPEDVRARVILGEVTWRLHRLDETEVHGQVLATGSTNPTAGLRLLALVAVARNQLARADDHLRRWLDAEPGSVEAMGLLADTLSRARRFDEAAQLFERAHLRRPDDLVLRTRHAHHLGRTGDFDQALAMFTDIARRSPNQGAHLANRGIAEMWAGQLDAAVASLEAAIALEPDAASHHWNLSHALLQKGALARGFEVSERRVAQFGVPLWWKARWRGEALPPGAPLALDAAQGLGDAIQLVRFAADAAQRGAAVVVRAHPRLLPLLACATGVSRAIPSTEPPPPGARRASLLSLPHVVGVRTVADLGHRVPYLRAEPDRVVRWTNRVAGPGLKLGIVWQGNPAYALDHLRSPPLEAYLRLTLLRGVRVFSLQKFHGIGQLAEVDRSVHPIDDLGPELDLEEPFLDTAAVLSALDLLVTSDTSVAHLAGALGVRTWLVLPFAPDWRWPRTGDRSAWYPTMRLFRQDQSGDWRGVFDAVVEALAALTDNGPCR